MDGCEPGTLEQNNTRVSWHQTRARNPKGGKRHFHASLKLAPSSTSSHHVRAGGSEGRRASVFQPCCRTMGFGEAAFPGLSGAGAAPAGAGGCPCSGCCRPVGNRCLQHGQRRCPSACPPLHTFRAAKRGLGWTGRARALGKKEAGVCLIPLRDAGSAARAERGWVAQGAGGGHRPRARRGRAGGCPRVSPSIPGARPAPSRTILVGVASWVFTVKAARLSLVGVSRAIYVCAPVCTYLKNPTQRGRGGRRAARPPARSLFTSNGYVSLPQMFSSSPSPLARLHPRPAFRPPDSTPSII